MTLRMSSKVRGRVAFRRRATRSIRRSSGCIAADDNALVIRLRKATVTEILDERRGAVEVSVALDPTGEPPADPLGLAVAVVYPALVGPVGLGDRVLVNTTAVELGLGTGGVHFV